MSVVVPHRSIAAIASAEDPKQAILKLAGDLSGVEVIGDMILVGIYIRPEKTKGGIFLTDNSKQEDVFQGKVGLVLKWGPDAFVDPESRNLATGGYDLYDQRVEVGEWCVFKIGDGWSVTINGLSCRLVRDTSIKLKIKDPNIVL